MFKDLPRLKRLDLAYTDVTDYGLKNVQGMHGLVSLNLDETAITDAGLDAVEKLQELEELRLWPRPSPMRAWPS